MTTLAAGCDKYQFIAIKMTSPHLPTRIDPTIVDVGNAIDDLVALRQSDPSLPECYVLMEADDGTGAFIQAIAVGATSKWMVEVCNPEEGSLRGLRQATSQDQAAELLARFVQGDRSLGNGAEWIDVDLAESSPVTPAGMAWVILSLLVAAVALWSYARTA